MRVSSRDSSVESMRSNNNNDDDADDILAIVYALHSVDMNMIETANETRCSFAESAASIIPAASPLSLSSKKGFVVSSTATLPPPLMLSSTVSDSTHSSFSSKQDQNNEWFFTAGITSSYDDTFHKRDSNEDSKEDKQLPKSCHFTCDIEEENLMNDRRKSSPGLLKKLVLPPSSVVLFDDDVATNTSEVTNRDFPASPPLASTKLRAAISNTSSSRWSSSCSLDSPIKARPTPGSYKGTYRPPIGREAFTQLAALKQNTKNEGNTGLTKNNIQQGKKDITSANNSPNGSRHQDNNCYYDSTSIVSDEILAQIFQEEELAASCSTSMSSIGLVCNDKSFSNLESMFHCGGAQKLSPGNKERLNVDEWFASMSQNLPDMPFNFSLDVERQMEGRTKLSHVLNSTMNTRHESIVDSDALYALEIQHRIEMEEKEQQKRMELQDEEIARRLSEDHDDITFLKDVELARRLSEEIDDDVNDTKGHIVSPSQDLKKSANNAQTDSSKGNGIKEYQEQSNVRDSVIILKPEILRKTNSPVRQISDDTTISSKYGESYYTSPDRAVRTTFPLKHGDSAYTSPGSAYLKPEILRKPNLPVRQISEGTTTTISSNHGESYTSPDRAFRTKIPLKQGESSSYTSPDRAFRRDMCQTIIKPEILRGQHNSLFIQKHNSPLIRNDITHNTDNQYERLRYNDTSNIVQPETYRKSPTKSYPSATTRVQQVSSHRREIDDYQSHSLRHEVRNNTRPSNNNGSIYQGDNSTIRRNTTGHNDMLLSSRMLRRDAASTSLLQPGVIRRNDSNINKQSKHYVIDGQQPTLSVRRVVVDQKNATRVQRLRHDLDKIMRSNVPQEDYSLCKDAPLNHRRMDRTGGDNIGGSDDDSFSSDLQDYLDRVQDMIRTSSR